MLPVCHLSRNNYTNTDSKSTTIQQSITQTVLAIHTPAHSNILQKQFSEQRAKHVQINELRLNSGETSEQWFSSAQFKEYELRLSQLLSATISAATLSDEHTV